MNKFLGISTICFEKLNSEYLAFFNENFSLFDIPIAQLSSFDKAIFSVQSLINNKEKPNASLVKAESDFIDLKSHFHNLGKTLSSKNISSVIYGSPYTRVERTSSLPVIQKRARQLHEVFSSYNIKLYIEALPKSLSDVFNDHSQLLNFHHNINQGIHVDIATAISNDEPYSFFEENLTSIDRFHLSVPGYGFDFENYEIALKLTKLFLSNGIKGTLEIQNYSNLNLDKLKTILNDL